LKIAIWVTFAFIGFRSPAGGGKAIAGYLNINTGGVTTSVLQKDLADFYFFSLPAGNIESFQARMRTGN
jgi:hypothetical protein